MSSSLILLYSRAKPVFPLHLKRIPLPHSSSGHAYHKHLEHHKQPQQWTCEWVPNLRERNIHFENLICSVTQSCFVSLKVNKHFQVFIAKATAKQQATPLQVLGPLKSPVPFLQVTPPITGQLSLLDLLSPLQFHQLVSSHGALFSFPGDEAPAEASKGQEKDQNQR